MAQITGSTTIDWSTVSLAQVDFEADFLHFINRVDQIFDALNAFQFSVVSASSSSLVVDLFSGGRLALGGSGFDSFPVINSFNFRNPPNGSGEVIRWTGTLDGGNEVFNSATIGSSGFSETIIGNIRFPETFPDSGQITGTLTSLRFQVGAARGTINGNFGITGDLASINLTGTVTGISVVSGINTIKMTGLSMPLDVLLAGFTSDALGTANDLFSFVSNQTTGNDTIIYTNNSASGMTFFGGAGNDTFTIKGPNVDTMLGGLGDDLYVVDSAGDIVTEAAGEGADTIRVKIATAGLPYILADNVENGTLVNTIAFNLTGNAEANLLTGNGASNTLLGLANNDTLNGRAGNDTLDGGTGDDTMIGGGGNDSFVVDSASDVVTEGIDGGTDTVSSSVSFTLGANVEHLTLTGSADIDGTGNALANTLTGNSGINILTGGAGNDTYVVQNETDSIVENVNAGIDLVKSSAANFTLAANVEHLTLTGDANINGTGNELKNNLTGNSGDNTLSGLAGNDRLVGAAGNDTLDGGQGSDTMVGGLGDDSYVVNIATDVVTEALNGGSDTVTSSLNYTLGANLENLVLTGSDNLNGTGNGLANTLTGNSGNNTLSGLAGNDTLIGDEGNDTLIGAAGQDSVTGGGGDDRITMLVTAGNVDTIDAGDGTDTLVLSGAVAGDHIVVADLSSLTDQVLSIGGVADAFTQVNFENLDASGIGSSLNVTGSGGDNVIIGSNGIDVIEGGAGNDTIVGMAGADNLQGGTGEDLFLIRSTSEFAASETIDGGDDTDTLRYTGNADATLTLTGNVTNIEQVEIANAAGDSTGKAAININAAAVTNGLTIIGNDGANVLTGTSQNDTFIGNKGNDTLRGGLGDDTYQVNEGDGRDKILENDSTPGNADTLLFDDSVDPLDLVFSRQVNDLRIAVHGTTDSITIQNWYTNPTAGQVETIQAGSGEVLLNTQVDQLIQAMATFTQQSGLTWDQAIEQQPGQVQTIIAANWH